MAEVDKIKLFGTVKWWSLQRGYGYISCGTQDYWVHYTAINNNKKFKKLKQGAQVTFCPEHNEKGDFASHVSVVED